MIRAAVPTAEVADLLADYWDAAAYHEAGHTVIASLLNQPVGHVALWHVRERGLFHPETWSVTGFTQVKPADPTVGVLVAVAGSEAEVFHTDVPHTTGRAANPSDLRAIRSYLRQSTLSEWEARDEARELLVEHWDAVECVATHLRERGQLSHRDLARIL